MKSIFRIYAKTSKGNDNYLLKQLHSLNIKPKYDQHMNSFYFNSTWSNLFDISFRCLTVQQMYIQIGQKFKIIDQQQITGQLQRLPFKNYMPIQRGLIQNTTLKIFVRQSIHMPSQNVLVSLITNNLNKQITKKEYYRQIQSSNKNLLSGNQQQRGMLQERRERKNHSSYFDIKETVQKKWWQDNQLKNQQRSNKIIHLQHQLQQTQQKQKKLLIQHNKSQVLKTISSNNSVQSTNSNSLTLSPQIQQTQALINTIKSQIYNLKEFSQQQFLSQQLAYHPHLIFYIRRNQGRFLLKINKDNLYKHGWKSQVNWGPIRQSIAASILHQSRMLQLQQHQNKKIRIWDPMCGSGTFGLVAATMLEQVPVRSNVEKLFEWVHWPVYKKDFLQQYWRQKQNEKKQNQLDYQLILSDKDRQTINYSIDNFRLLVEGGKQQFASKSNLIEQKSEIFPSKTALSETLELVSGKVGFARGDFQQVMKLLKNQPLNNNQTQQKVITPLTIITNLPYIHSRSQQKYPLNQLTSIYSRFSTMIKQNASIIDNVFIIVDKNILSKNHFLNVSQVKWTLIGQYNSGGLQIGLYAWQENKIKSKFQDSTVLSGDTALVEYEKIKGQITSEDRQIILRKQKTVQKALIQYRKKLSQIDRKYYHLPKHLVRDAKGWRRIIQKRRKRHLQSAYELFARRREKLIALKQYAHQKLQLKMLKRGTVWKNKNLRFFNHSDQKLSEYSEQIKKIFENKIQEALKRQQDYQQRKKLKAGDKIEVVKINNKWNADERKMVKQIKNSKGHQTYDKRSVNGKARASKNYKK